MHAEIHSDSSATVLGDTYTFRLNEHRDVVELRSTTAAAGPIDVEYSAAWAPIARAIETALAR